MLTTTDSAGRVAFSNRTTFLNKTGPNHDSLKILSRRKDGCFQIYTGITGALTSYPFKGQPHTDTTRHDTRCRI